ncbi:hypothetical protein [Pseudomonas tohonis]|uniref:hypothetical protein n=1 Tax=Pseudomonas tohonis TaxID=2725477 RepID=UPI00255B89C1|nr:hypothetical protein [Pseudomonas tohonis]
MVWRDVAVSRAGRFAIGVEEGSGRHYLAISVSNRLVDYEERYAISVEDFERYGRNLDSALPFVEQCRARLMDHLLLEPPGADRGIPG